MKLQWSLTPNGTFARGKIPGGTVEYTIARCGEGHRWLVVVEHEGEIKKPRNTTAALTTLRTIETTVAEPSLMAMKQLSQDDYETRTR